MRRLPGFRNSKWYDCQSHSTGFVRGCLSGKAAPDLLPVVQSCIPLLPCPALLCRRTVGSGTGTSPCHASQVHAGTKAHDRTRTVQYAITLPTPDSQSIGAIVTHRLLTTSIAYQHNDNTSNNETRGTVLVALVFTGSTQRIKQNKPKQHKTRRHGRLSYYYDHQRHSATIHRPS